jgi:hypothetical protein
MQPITGIIILGISIFLLGVFLIFAGYEASLTSLGFGAYFVLVGGMFAVVLPILTARITPRYVEPQPAPRAQNNSPANPTARTTASAATGNTSNNRPAARRDRPATQSAELQPSGQSSSDGAGAPGRGK